MQHGKSTVVNNFWQDGELNVLSALVQHSDHLPPNFVADLLEVRLHLAPAYTRAAVERVGDEVATFLDGRGLSLSKPILPDTPAAYASFDWQLHRLLTLKSGNPIYTLILNGFANFYEEIAQLYFATAAARQLSRQFYDDLAQAFGAVRPIRVGHFHTDDFHLRRLFGAQDAHVTQAGGFGTVPKLSSPKHQ